MGSEAALLWSGRGGAQLQTALTPDNRRFSDGDVERARLLHHYRCTNAALELLDHVADIANILAHNAGIRAGEIIAPRCCLLDGQTVDLNQGDTEIGSSSRTYSDGAYRD